MTDKSLVGPVKIIEESGERFAVIPEKKFKEMMRLLEELQDSLEMKKAIQEGGEFMSLEELDEKLSKAGLV